MPAVSICNLPDEEHRDLKLCNTHHGRCTEAEMRALEASVRPAERIWLGSVGIEPGGGID